MAGIETYLEQIKNAIYGKDVRQAIHDGIEQCYEDGKAGAVDLVARQEIAELVAPTGEAPSAAEVTDARVGADGVTYTSLGLANRTQFENVQYDVVSDRSLVSSDNAGRSTVCIPLGEVAEKTIITKNTGIPRSGGVNNFATANFIPIPNKVIYVISKYCSFYVTGYDKCHRHAAEYSREDSVHGFGMITIDNTNGALAFLKIGFYTSAGYSAERYAAAEVLYHTDAVQESDDFIMSQMLNAYSLSSTAVGASTSAPQYSDIRIGPKAYRKAEKNISIIRDGDASWRYLLTLAKGVNASGAGTDLVYADWNRSPQDDVGTIIPKGSYYWLGYAYGNNAMANVDTAIKEVPEYIKVKELEDGELGYYEFTSGFDVGYTSLIRVGTGDMYYADTDLFIQSLNPAYNFSVKLYEDNNWYSKAWAAHYSVQSVYIPKGAWYRYNVGRADRTVIEAKDMERVYNMARVFRTWEVPSNIVKQIAGLQNDLSFLRRRISELEQNAVPSYYETHIATKATAINQHKSAMTDGDQFMFITDIHINGYGGNTMHSKALINYLCRNTDVRKLFNGGDLFSSGYGMSSPEALDMIQQALNYTQPDDCNGVQYFVMGNHDLGDDYIDGQHYGSSISATQLYRACGNDSKRSALVFDPNSDACYYFEENGIRYIVSDFGIDSYTSESIGNTYLFVTKAIKTANCPVVIVQHVLWNNPTEDASFRPYRLGVLEDIVDACNNRATCQYGDSTDYLVDFSDSTSRVCCIVGGHLHTDRVSYTRTLVPIIATTTDNVDGEYNLESTGRVNGRGTVNEQAFDVFTIDLTNSKVYVTRIGYGSDREYDIPSVS